VELVREKEVETYVENCRRVRAFRDRNFTVKNYRIFDMAAWELENKMEKMEEFSGRKTIDGFYPILEEYDPGITKERYLELFANKERYKPENMYTLYYLLQMDGAATCKQLAQRFGETPGRYLGNGNALCKNVAKDTECPLYKDRDGANIFWSVLF
ncbi:hypothetical protein, partial [Bacillus licheniformis]|uniref:hypothetical protein n=1 Tax=Bacillus licheniformis TaxID=1402 RepID=UPI001C89F7B2